MEMELLEWCGGNGRGGCGERELAGLEANTGGDARVGCMRHAGRAINSFG